MYTDPSGYLSSADITAGTIIQANLINTGMSVYLTVLHKLYAASNVDVEEFKTISGGDWAWSMFESTFGAGFFINNLILCLAMTNIVGACVMIGVVSTVMCMLFTIAAADAALDENDALEQYYGMMAVLSLAGAFFGFDQAMKEAGITADQLAVAKENASVVTDSTIDINNTTVPEVSGGARGTGSSVGKGNANSNENIDIDKILESASQDKKGGETVAGHALQKHAGRNPNIWGKVSGNTETINNSAMQHIRDILDEPGNFRAVESNGRTFMEKMLPDGRGIRLNMDGSFKGFIDQIR